MGSKQGSDDLSARKRPRTSNEEEPADNNILVHMIDDSTQELQAEIAELRRGHDELRRDLTEEAEQNRRRNLLIFNWPENVEEKNVSTLEKNVIDWINQHLLKSEAPNGITMDASWVSKVHTMPQRKQGANNDSFTSANETTDQSAAPASNSQSATDQAKAPTCTVMLQLALDKQMDIIWSRRTNLKSMNEARKASKLPSIILDRHHTKAYGRQLRYLNKIRIHLIKDKKYHAGRIRINGNKRDRPYLTVDMKPYNASTIPESLYGTVGAYGQK